MFPDRLKAHAGEIAGTTTSALGVITARQDEFEWWFRQCGTAIAIIAGILTIRSLLKNKK